MKHLSLKDVRDVQNKRDKKREEAFDYILNMAYRHIHKCVSTLRSTYFCFYEIPEFVLGFPLFDLNECVTYLHNRLVKGGFQVKYFFPNVLMISWGSARPKKEKLTHQGK
jgi:hypothetical protein